MQELVLQARNLSKTYGGSTLALRDISFDLRKGEMVCVIGPSGAGKSTLLRCINRMIEADKGSSLLFDGKEITALRKKELAQVRREIGMIFQHYNLVYRLSALENVLHGRMGYYSTFAGAFSLYKKEDVERAVELLGMLGLEERVYFRCANLSGGQKQRVGIARALIQDPKLILCDEPIASLDPQSSKVIMEYLKGVSAEMGIPCLVNLHQVDVAKFYADRIIGMKKGAIVFDGSVEELTDERIEDIYGAKIHEILA